MTEFIWMGSGHPLFEELQRLRHSIFTMEFGLPQNFGGADDRTGTAAVGRIDQHTSVARIQNNALDRRRFGADDRNDAPGRHHIAKADIDQL